MKSVGRILLADDDESIRSTLSEFFTTLGYEVVEAQDGEDALRKFAPGKFDCVISDFSMPGMNGIELLRRIQLLEDGIYFLIITGFQGIDSAVDALKEGAYDYLMKPFHMDDIQCKVERALNVRKTEILLKKNRNLLLTLIILIPVLISFGIIFGIYWEGIR
ncbi:MAG: response regulator [Syntrophales bacterium]